MPTPGTVFQVIPEGGNHFWIVISAPKNGRVLAVNITDAKNCPHSPCIIEIGEHPAVTMQSAVYYRKAREFEGVKIDEFIATGENIRRLADCSPVLLERIIDGARKSDELTFRFLSYLE
jgi:hypothetical protein